MTGPKQLLRMGPATAVLLTLALAGCGTSMNPLSSAPSGTIQPQSQPATGPVLGYIWDSSSQGLRPSSGTARRVDPRRRHRLRFGPERGLHRHRLLRSLGHGIVSGCKWRGLSVSAIRWRTNQDRKCSRSQRPRLEQRGKLRTGNRRECLGRQYRLGYLRTAAISGGP